MHICFTISSLHCGGSERVISTLANSFSKKGHDVSIVLVSVSNSFSFYELEPGVRVVPVLKRDKKTNPIKRVLLLRKVLKRINPSVVISFLPHISIYTHYALIGTNIVHICSERNNPNHYSPKRKRLLKKVFKKANGCVFQTSEARHFYNEVDDNKCITIKNPVFLMPESVDFNPPKEKVFISVGRLEQQKRFDILIKAFAVFHKNHPDYRLMIFGDGSLKDYLNNLIVKMNIDDFAELMGSSNSWHLFAKKCTAFISSSEYEGMPNCLEEALCLGCNCIATDCPCGGSRELIELLGTGKLVKPCDENDLLSAMECVINFPKSNGAINFDVLKPEYIAEKWLKFISEISNLKK